MPLQIINLSRQRKNGEVYGFDGGEKVKCRKRHIIVDPQGLLIGVLVSKTNASERLGAIIVLNEAKEKLSNLGVIWVDQGYSGKNFASAVQLGVCGECTDGKCMSGECTGEVIERTSKTFEQLPKRWIVE